MQISLSKRCPLDITLKGAGYKSDVICDICDILIPHVKRWRSIRLLFGTSVSQSIQNTLSKCIASGAPILETFEYNSRFPGTASARRLFTYVLANKSLTFNFSRSTLLREIKLSKLQIQEITFVTSAKDMLHLTVEKADACAFRRALQLFPYADRVHCYVEPSMEDWELLKLRMQPTVDHKLRALTLRFLRGEISTECDGSKILIDVQLPRLEELVIAYKQPMTFQLSKMIGRFGCNLKKLSLITDAYRFDKLDYTVDLLPALKQSPYLQELCIIGNIQNSIFRDLARMTLKKDKSPDDFLLCPNLTKLTLSVRKPISYESICAMVASRGDLASISSRKSGPTGIFLTLIGHMGDLQKHSNVLDCLRKYGVRCSLYAADKPLHVDEYLKTLPRDEN